MFSFHVLLNFFYCNRRKLDILLPSWLEDANAYDQSSNLSMGIVGLYVVVNLTVGIICLMYFSFIRMRYPLIFAPKKKSPPILPFHDPLSWMIVLYNINEEQVIESAGYDVLFFIRFYILSFKIFSVFSIYAWGVLMPING